MNNTVVFIIEMIGTVAFAVSGAMVGINRHMDIFGVCVLGVITSVGGGMIRDIILGNIPPNVFYHPIYLLVSVIVSCLMFLGIYLGKKHKNEHVSAIYDSLLLIMDTIGLAIFTVLGVNAGFERGFTNRIVLLVFVGTITGVGGGLLRDMMAGVPPYIFVKHVYACASILGALTTSLLYPYMYSEHAMLLGFVVVVLIRFFAIHFKWNLPKL